MYNMYRRAEEFTRMHTTYSRWLKEQEKNKK